MNISLITYRSVSSTTTLLSVAYEEEQNEGKVIRTRLNILETQLAEYEQHMVSLQNEAQRQEAFSLGTNDVLLLYYMDVWIL